MAHQHVKQRLLSSLRSSPPLKPTVQPAFMSAACPFSSRSSRQSPQAQPLAASTINNLPPPLACPFASRQLAKHRTAPPASIVSLSFPSAPTPPASKRAPTAFPDLFASSSSTEELLYLPPLLSLLPDSAAPSHRSEDAFDFDKPKVGFTESRLPSIDNASIALHHALHSFRPLSHDYALADYDAAFNWDELRLPKDVQREWYIVAFRSHRNLESSSVDLYMADRHAHEEAVQNGGLVLYWYGSPDVLGRNLATCVWQSRAHAVAANSGPKHQEAMRLASEMYLSYDLERYVLKKRRGEEGVTVEAWTGGEVDFE